MAVLAYIVKDGRVLLIKRGLPPYRNYWSFPGGGTKPGEGPREACIREVEEETGLDVEVLEEVGSVRGSPIFSCKVLAGEAKAHPPETLTVSWIPLTLTAWFNQKAKLIVPFIREFLEATRDPEEDFYEYE